MTEDLQRFSAICDWCGMETVNYVQEAMLTTVSFENPLLGRQAWRVCVECHLALLGLQASRRDVNIIDR